MSLRKLDEQLFHESKSLRWKDLKKSLTNVSILEFASFAHKETWHKERKYEWVLYWNLLSFQWQPNICYEEVIRELIKTDGETLRIASIITIVGNLLIEMGQYQEAETFVKKAIEVEYSLFGPSPKLVPAFNNLAMLYKLQGKYRNSLSYFEESLRFLDLERNSEKSVLATVLNNLAQLYIELGYLDKALVFHNRALNIRRELFHTRHPELGISLDNIGKTLQVLGRFEEALTYHEEALAVLKETTGAKSIDVAKCLTNMGHANHLLGDSENAVVFYNRALGIIDEILGSGHLSTAILLNNLGGVSSRT